MITVVSIIIPLFNKEKFIEQTLKSVSQQTFSNWECIIIDDKSTDKSFQIARDYIKNDKRFSLIKNLNKGAGAARNLGLRDAKGKYIQFLDADDVISDEKLESQVALFQKNHEISFVTCAWGRFRQSNFESYHQYMDSYRDFDSSLQFLESLITSKGYFPIHSYLIRREIINKAGYFNESLSLNDDGEFMMRVIVNSKKIKFALDAIAWYQISEGISLSSFKSKEAVEKAIYSWMLIEINLKIRFGEKAEKFIEWSKSRFFINLKKSYPELIKQNYYFFEKQSREERIKEKFLIRAKHKIIKFLK